MANPSRILRAVTFKALALGSSLVNVVIAGLVLPNETALLYLAMLSTIQTTIPFAGLGLGQRLVQLTPQKAQKMRVWPWFFLSTSIGLGLLVLQSRAAGFGLNEPLVLLAAIFMGHIAVSEYIRAGQARQTGFHIYNIALLAIAFSVWAQSGIGFAAPSIAALGLIACIIKERASLSTPRDTPLHPTFKDISTAFRVLSINQYYNVLVVALTLLAPSPELFAVVLVWRFNIFFNWQTFYWLRFGHKDLGAGPTAAQRRENLKVTGLNVAACMSACAVAYVALYTDLLSALSDTAFDAAFFKLLVAYAVLRTTINLIFPYELFSVYGARPSEDAQFFALVAVTVALIIAVALTVSTPFVLIATVEIGALIWRLFCARWARTLKDTV